jgi:hypothetical protein
MADESSNGGGGGSAIRTAAVAAAATAGLAAARAAIAKRGGGSGGMTRPVVHAAWDAAREHLVGPAEDAVAALGRHVAEHGPELLRDRLVPRFLESFEEALARDSKTAREARNQS